MTTSLPLVGVRRQKKIVIISAFHDYRSKKRASIHHIAEGLVAAVAMLHSSLRGSVHDL